MKSLLVAVCALFFVSNAELAKATPQLFRELETKLQNNLISKLDAQGVKQLESLVELTAFSELTDMAQLSPEELKEFLVDLPNFKEPEVDMSVYNA